ncbi:glycosyl hydrolase family 20, catalytic domain protein [Asticcacaulis biprosthecium C19]|uniref:beta-N-acetylhexosaminidase n=1 Tax=Asticcacaulis biprosthecium C19 TaxID=715226 RepID=F4QL95_9CAUL|nr:beta-N-acetylhexosaminidase [Asticcacaulis biprosthecium]EGF93470.1 glycosyl hydrolase family 20, catalytic domain protein [Asticcacaulis biprosthecium C19]
MKLTVLTALLAALLATPALAMPTLTPVPAQITQGEGSFALTAKTQIYVPAGDSDARNAAVYLRDHLKTSRKLSVQIVTGEPATGEAAIRFVRASAAGDRESYRLEVTSGSVVVTAGTREGLFYGAVTLWQLATQDAATGTAQVPAVVIADTPRFKWRGFMLDSVRHFQTPAQIKKIIDAMAIHKLNVLQWHLTDDQGWRLEIKAYPKLTQKTAYRQEAGAAGWKDSKPLWYGGYYTQDQVRDIVAYAAARNITVVPEIDVPGHATAIITAYPEFGTEGTRPKQGMSDWGVYPNLLNVEDRTFVFLDTVFNEVMDLFPSPYIHVGGDEAIKPQWQASPAIQAKIRDLGLKDEHELQSWFIQRVGTSLTKRGRRLIGWDEILEGGIASDATVMSWRGVDGAITAARSGHDTVLSPAPMLYFDHRQSPFRDEPPGRGKPTTLRTVYDFNPALDAMTDAERKHVLGLQANLWTEHIRTDERVEIMAFPRLIAVAEVGWSLQSSHDWDDFTRRLPASLHRLDKVGTRYNTVPFEPHMTLSPAPDGRITVALRNGLDLGEIRVDGAVYSAPVTVAEGTVLTTQTFLNGEPLGRERKLSVTRAALETRTSYDLDICEGKLNLALEDDGGERAVMLMDILKPCWIWRGADTSKGFKITAKVANYPFNFQLGNRPGQILFDTPQTRDGELLVRMGDCTSEPVARLPLAKAAKSTGVTVLTGDMPAVAGTNDLCFTFAQGTPPPEWALQEVRLTPALP